MYLQDNAINGQSSKVCGSRETNREKVQFHLLSHRLAYLTVQAAGNSPDPSLEESGNQYNH